MSELRAPWITEPGVYPDVTEDEYHRDPVVGGSLSCSGAKKLLPPSCPAKFAYERAHPPEPKAHFEFGSAAHRLVLGAGPDLQRIEADSWRTKAAKAARDDARDRGRIPLLAEDHDRVHAMADALRAHETAAALLDPNHGAPEQCVVWRDHRTGIMCRALIDWLRPPPERGQRLIVPDYKTTARVGDPDSFSREAWDFRYCQQAAWFTDGLIAMGHATDAVFVFILQEKNPPYLVTCFEPEPLELQVGRYLNAQALDLYAHCTATDTWPTYGDGVLVNRLPQWVANRYAQELNA